MKLNSTLQFSDSPGQLSLDDEIQKILQATIHSPFGWKALEAFGWMTVWAAYIAEIFLTVSSLTRSHKVIRIDPSSCHCKPVTSRQFRIHKTVNWEVRNGVVRQTHRSYKDLQRCCDKAFRRIHVNKKQPKGKKTIKVKIKFVYVN